MHGKMTSPVRAEKYQVQKDKTANFHKKYIYISVEL